VNFYGDTTQANSGSSGPQTINITNDPYNANPSPSTAPSAPGATDAGKGSFDFGDPTGSVQQTAGNFGDFLGGIGKIGIPGGPNLGGIAGVAAAPVRFGAEVAGNALGVLGGVSLPYLGNDPTKTNAHLGDVPGVIGNVLGAPERFIETQAAKARLGSGGGVSPTAQHYLGMTAQQGQAAYGLPADIQARLDSGENVDKIASDMASQGRGFSNDAVANTVAGFALDPMNLLSLGAGKVASIAKDADRALQAGQQLGVGERFMGTAYGAASRGLSAGGQALMDHTIGPATSGVFHALGTAPFNAVKNAAASIAPEYGQAFMDAFARGAAQLPRAVIARYMAEEATSAIKQYGKAAISHLPSDISGSIEARLQAIRTVNPDQIERRTEALLTRTAPDFAGHSPEAMFQETRDKLAQITGMSAEDAARALGGKVNTKTAQTVHLAFYGKAGDDLARAKAVSATAGLPGKVDPFADFTGGPATGAAPSIDPERLTLIGSDTLTKDRAAEILSGKQDLNAAVDQYSILRNRFGNTAFGHADVRDFIEKLAKQDALPQAVKEPTTGAHALPPALQDWKKAYEPFDYQIGFAPKDGWKTIVDPNTGDVAYADPFAHFTSEADPLTQRNPIGRFMDSLFRGSTQTQIIADSRARMVAVTRPAGVSANEARAIHQRILQTAADAAVSPRGLSLGPSDTYSKIFQEVLGPDRFAQMVQKVDPDFAVMKSFEGNLSRVGITQKITGKVKTATAGRGNPVAAIAEGIYPALRFRFSPLFQAQEIVESPFFNLIRGTRDRIVTADVQKVYNELSDLPDFKYLAEAGYTLNIAGANEVSRTITANNTLIGKALSHAPNVKAFKERQRIAQVFSEHGPNFEDAVNSINPALWQTMKDAYGTSDPAQIADRFIQERMSLASGNMDQAMATFDAAKPSFDAAIPQSHDAETVWQAFRESFRQTSEQAFKTHYFNPTRGFLERSINHPYLGIYPASYMWGKVLPEFARFLLLRPFGLKAPLVGLEAYQRVQQSVIAQLGMNPAAKKWVDTSGKTGALYLLDQLLPASPANIPANAPAWSRHLSQDLSANKKIDPQTFVTREAGDTFKNAAGPLKSLNAATGALGDIYDIGGDIFKQLSSAAYQLDAQFPRAGTPPPAPQPQPIGSPGGFTSPPAIP
jgi:hypothetical protein